MFEADARRQTREEEAAGRKDPPELLDDAAEVIVVVGEVQDRAANDRVHARVVPGHRVESGELDPLRRQRRREPREQCADGRDRRGIVVGGVDVEAGAQEVWEVAARAAPGIEDAAAFVEGPLQELIEDVDVDRPELLEQIDRWLAQGLTFSAT